MSASHMRVGLPETARSGRGRCLSSQAPSHLRDPWNVGVRRGWLQLRGRVQRYPTGNVGPVGAESIEGPASPWGRGARRTPALPRWLPPTP